MDNQQHTPGPWNVKWTFGGDFDPDLVALARVRYHRAGAETMTTETQREPLNRYAVFSRKHVQLGPTFPTATDADSYRRDNYPGARITDLHTGKVIRPADVDATDATDRLRKLVNPGDTLHTIFRHVSRSGMMRHISIVKVDSDGSVFDLSYLAARAIGWGRTDAGYLKVQGCGMDVGFHAVYTISRTLYPDGFDCLATDADNVPTDSRSAHRVCPSNDHSNYRNGDSPTRHTDGGYALSHRWL